MSSIGEKLAEVGTKVGGVVAVDTLPPAPLYHEGGTVMRLHMEALAIDEIEARVTAGVGLGGDFISLECGEHQATFFLRDVLREWIATFDPEKAARMPKTAYEVNFRPEVSS